MALSGNTVPKKNNELLVNHHFHPSKCDNWWADPANLSRTQPGETAQVPVCPKVNKWKGKDLSPSQNNILYYSKCLAEPQGKKQMLRFWFQIRMFQNHWALRSQPAAPDGRNIRCGAAKFKPGANAAQKTPSKNGHHMNRGRWSSSN